MKSDNQRYPQVLRPKAIVATSALERGVVIAVGWMARPHYPFAAFESTAAAKTWLLAHLAGAPAITTG